MMRTPRRPITMKELLQAQTLERQGYSQREIAALLGHACHSAIGRHLRRSGPCPRGPATVSALPRRRRELRACVREGLYASQIAVRMKIGIATVWRWLRRLRLKAADGRAVVARPRSEETLERIAQGNSEHLRGVCAALGWPEVTIPVHARILALLAAGGPLTHQEITQGLRRRTFARRGGQPRCPCVVRSVKQLQHLRMVVKTRGPGHRVSYSVSAWLLARRGDLS